MSLYRIYDVQILYLLQFSMTTGAGGVMGASVGGWVLGGGVIVSQILCQQLSSSIKMYTIKALKFNVIKMAF